MYRDPIDVQSGDVVTLGSTDPEWPGWQWCTDSRGKSGWVPIVYINRHSDGTGVMRSEFTARELSIAPDEVIKLHKAESGWYWASSRTGKKGWIPATHVIVSPDQFLQDQFK